jgi:hypothetical protein
VTRDPWEDFAEVFADVINAHAILSDEDLDAMAAEYQRDAIASAQSEAAQEAARKEYSHER